MEHFDIVEECPAPPFYYGVLADHVFPPQRLIVQSQYKNIKELDYKLALTR